MRAVARADLDRASALLDGASDSGKLGLEKGSCR
ncbi:MAG: hypothetical protein JWN48_4232 [Myxococcaceae bacterium]|nr:hypothetical protein [Myxococcaceae bacterium]